MTESMEQVKTFIEMYHNTQIKPRTSLVVLEKALIFFQKDPIVLAESNIPSV